MKNKILNKQYVCVCVCVCVDTGGVLTSSLGVNTAQPGGCLAQLPRCREGNSLEQQ